MGTLWILRHDTVQISESVIDTSLAAPIFFCRAIYFAIYDAMERAFVPEEAIELADFLKTEVDSFFAPAKLKEEVVLSIYR